MRHIGIVALAMVMTSCKTIEQVSDQDLARNVNLAAKGAAKHGLKYAINQNPDQAEALKANAKVAVQLIREQVLPVFDGATTADVLRSAVDEALQRLSAQLSPTVANVIQLALNVAASQIKLPANPADKLSPRMRMAIYAFFSGVCDGLEEAYTNQDTKFKPNQLEWPQ